ncbi:uncharacterized protein ACNLHF_026367 isoform 1-T1 [Anomaloglossus baeobatrachus]|uniref:uncharacterized protein LOC142245303 n=1 Tax=Anomaloglossus baeobatrachus TaxID=238106 RepID=UPI003F501A90
MLFRLFLLLIVLLALVEPAPIGHRRNHSGAQNRIHAGIKKHLRYGPCSVTCGIGTREVYLNRGCQENNMDKCFLRFEKCIGPARCGLDDINSPNISHDKVMWIVPAAGALFVFAISIVVICSLHYKCLLKNKTMKDTEMDADDIRESDPNLNGKHEDYISITIDDSPQGTMDDQRDVFTGSKISVPGPPDNISPGEEVVTSSNRNHEVVITFPNENVHHEPLAEEGDVLQETKINTAEPSDAILTISLNGNVVTPSEGELEICGLELKKSITKPDLDDYKRKPPSILKGRNQVKNQNKGKRVTFQESDNQYVYIYDSESSQPGRLMRYFRDEKSRVESH